MKQLFIYALAGIFILAGIISIRFNFKNESTQERLKRVNYIPIKNYGKPFLLFFGVFLIGLGLFLLFKI